MLERIKDIRLSERRIYLKITDIFALASDYDKNSILAQTFFAFIQNQLHFAVSGKTAAELIYTRADSKKAHMGLTNWAHSPNGKIYKTDVTIGKNYLNEDELHRLRGAISAFLDIAQLRAERKLPTTMQDWLGFMENYLNLNDFPVLKGAGKISKEQADEKAISEYEKFRPIQDANYVSDFDREIEQLEKKLEKKE